jgi:hypothetical protein
MRSYLKKPITKRAAEVAQGEGPEFKLQYGKKQRNLPIRCHFTLTIKKTITSADKDTADGNVGAVTLENRLAAPPKLNTDYLNSSTRYLPKTEMYFHTKTYTRVFIVV